MSGRWSLQASPASQHKPTNSTRCNIGNGQQSVLLLVPRRSRAVHGSRSIGVPGEHHTGNGSSRISCASSTPAAQAAVAASGTAPLLMHAPHSTAYHSVKGTINIARHCNSIEQQQRPRQQQMQQYVGTQMGGQEGSQSGSAAVHHSSNGKANSSNPANITSANMAAGSSYSHVRTAAAADAAEPLKYHITRSIKRCRCWQEIDAVVREYGPAFNIIHISAAITHLAQLSTSTVQQQQQQQLQHAPQLGQEQQQEQQLEGDLQLVQGIALITQQMERQHQQLQLSLLQHGQHQQHAGFQQWQHMQLLQQLLDRAVLHLSEAGSRQVANMLWALAQLQYAWRASAAATAAVAALAQAAAQLFMRADAQHLSNMAYAAAKLQLPVDQAWLASLQEAWLQLVLQVQRQESSSHESSSDSSSSPSGRHSSSSRSQHSSSSQSATVAPHAYISPQAAANMMWALVHLQQQQPGTAWLQQVVSATAGNLLDWPARSVAMFMWGCAKLGYDAGAAQPATSASEQLSRQEVGYGTQQGELQQRQAHSDCPHQQQQVLDVPALLLQALQVHIKDFSCQDVSQVLWAAAVMNLQLPAPLLQQLLASSSAQLPAQLVQLPAGRVSSGSNDSGRPHSSSNAPGSAAVAHSASLVLYSLARLGVMPQQQLPPLLLRPWLAALLANSSSADSHCLASAAWAICKLGLASSCPLVVKAMLEAAQRRLQQSSSSSNMQQLEINQRPADAMWSGARAAEVSSRAVASLMRTAAYCTTPTAAATARNQRSHACVVSAPSLHTNAMTRQQQLGSASQWEYLRQRQQQQLRLMLQGMQLAGMQQAGPDRGISSSSSSSRPQPTPLQRGAGQGGSTAGRIPSAAQAIQTAALQLLLTAAGIPLALPGSEQQHLQQVQADGLYQPALHSFQQQPPLHNSAPQQQLLLSEVLPGASLMDLSQVLWAASCMKLQLPQSWWQRCIWQVQQLLPQQQQAAAQSLVLSVWALGKARALVPPELVVALQHASLPLLQPSQQHNCHQQQLHPLTPQGHAMLLVGFVRLCTVAGHQLPATRHLKQQWQVRAAKRRSKQLKHGQSSSTAQTSATSSSWARGSCGSRAPAGHQTTQQGLRTTQQDRGCVDSRSKQLFRVERTARRLQQRRRRCRRHLQLHQHYWVHAAGLSPDWLQAYCMSAAQQLSSFTPTGLTALLWGLGKLRYHPGTSFLATALQCVELQLPHMSARHIALLLWSLQRLQHMPGDELLSVVMQSWECRLASASKADSQQVQWVQQQIRQMQSRQS